MNKKYIDLLGKKVKPLIRMKYYDVNNEPESDILPYLKGEERIVAVKRIMYNKKRKLKERYNKQQWIVWGIFADGTFELISDMGYSEKGVSRKDFRLILK